MVVNRFFRVRRRGVWGNALRSEGGGVMRGVQGASIYYALWRWFYSAFQRLGCDTGFSFSRAEAQRRGERHFGERVAF
jgi:hypothetical protein